jgi:hypothetical protein
MCLKYEIFCFFDIITIRGIMRKKGYILIVTTIIIALILSGLLYATSIWLRTHATESTEIAQREIALYAAQYGINEMIYNLNTGTTYTNGQSISGTTPSGYSYTATYYTGDTFGGTAYIKGVGTAGSFTRTIYASIIGGNSEAFKYCLFTQTGGYTKTNYGSYPTITMNNILYPGYTYNQTGASLPNPDWAWYTNFANYPSNTFVQLKSANRTDTLNPSNYSGKVVYVNYTGNKNNATLTINFGAGNYNVSILTNYPIVNIVWNAGTGNNTTWTPIAYSSNTEYPIFLHNPSLTTQSKFKFDLTNTNNNNKTFTVQGFLYSNSPVTFSYGFAWGYLNINGTLFAKSLTTDRDYNKTTFNYTKDYYNNPPPHFGSASGFTYLPGSYREEF